VVEKLLKYGANVNPPQVEGVDNVTPLEMAETLNAHRKVYSPTILKLLLDVSNLVIEDGKRASLKVLAHQSAKQPSHPFHRHDDVTHTEEPATNPMHVAALDAQKPEYAELGGGRRCRRKTRRRKTRRRKTRRRKTRRRKTHSLRKRKTTQKKRHKK
jgi:hypothetical protein